MKRIASFTVNHDTLLKGMYISRIDKDVVTYDIRMKKPNGGDYLSTPAAHTIEHLFATYARNTAESDNIIYVGPMGCRTGFYFLTRDTVSHERAIEIVKESMDFIANFEGEIPGNTARECGNYLEHDLEGAKVIAKDMSAVLENWKKSDLEYK
ncbi:MAG: S-ribosylhomocysteine lyase [Clostridia bacterium]|nr:S-ribosylhomocysteine lyase [Clostridia bacterium]